MNDYFPRFPLMIAPRYELLNPGVPGDGTAGQAPDHDEPTTPTPAPHLHIVRSDEETMPVD